MLTDCQRLVLKKLLSFFLFTGNIFGLWPFRFASNNRHIEYSYLKAFYSALMCFIGSTTYSIIGSYIFNIIGQRHFTSFTLKFISSLHGYTLLVVFVAVYIGPHLNSRKIEIAYSKCKEIVDIMNQIFSHKCFSIWIYILKIIVKTVVYDTILILLSIQSYSRSTNLRASKMFFLLLLPFIAVRLHMNVFYGALLVFKVYFEKLNESLNEIVTAAKNVQSKQSSELSDQLDNMAGLYCRLMDVVKMINSIFSLNIILGDMTTAIGLTMQSLFLFIAFIKLIRQGSDFFIFINTFGFAFILLFSYDLFTTANAAERLVQEVCNRSSNEPESI